MRLGVSYIPPHQPNHIETDMKYLKSIGCTDVLFALQENHFQWLDGSVRFGPKIAEDNGLCPSVVIWGYANTSGGGRSSKIMLENPDMWRCDEKGIPFGGGYPNPMMCYNNPKAISKYAEYIEQCWYNGFKGVLIDEPAPQNCFCNNCKNKFSSIFQQDIVNSIGGNNYKIFQHQTVVDFVKNSCVAAKTISDDLKTLLCLMPQNRNLFEEMVSIPNLDIFSTDPYWLRPINQLSFTDAIDISLYGKDIAYKNRKSFTLFLGCFGISSGLEEKIYSEGKILVDRVQPNLLITWSFRGGIGLGKLSSEECDNPHLAWDSVVKLYKELSGI